MARQKEQPEPTNEPGDPPPAEPKKPAADDVAVCLVRPRPREKRDDNRTLEHGGSSTAALDFRSAEGGRGVALARAPGAPAREPVAASGSRRRESARARRRGRLARSPAPAPRPTPTSPRAGEPRAFSDSKATNPPVRSCARFPRLPTQSCKRTRLKKFFSPGRACCAECLKVRPEARPAGRPPRSRAEPPDPRRSPAQILTTKHTVERQNAGRAPSFVPGSETRRRSFSGSFSIAPVGLGTRGTRTKKAVRARWIETNRETTV